MASKEKFELYAYSYTVRDHFLARKFNYNDHAKIDYYYNSNFGDHLTYDNFMKIFIKHRPNFSFLHFALCDTIGHRFTWNINEGSQYLSAVTYIDSLLGQIIQHVKREHNLGHSIVLVITSDHGGSGNNHNEIANNRNYTIPFIVWGTDIARGKELYAINKKSRKDPGTERISYEEKQQPIRNSDGANLILSLMGLGPIEHSTINAKQDLNVSQ